MNPFSFEEIQELFFTLLENLTHESGRGAILIATTHADDHLKQLLEAAMRSDINKAAKEKLFNYPGPLSSFAAKIELAFMFRFINRGLYNSLHALRKIRNDAAHSEKKFQLHELKEKFYGVFNIGEGMSYVVKKTAMETLVHHKMTEITEIIEKENFTEEEKAKLIRDLLTNPENIKKLERQLPFWELAYGISLVCGLLVYYKKKVSKLTVDINTWSDLVKDSQIE